MNEQILKDLVATAQKYNYDWNVVIPKFPEFKGYDAQLLKDYVATAEKYNYDYATVNSKFPEFKLKKKEPTASPSQSVQKPSSSATQGKKPQPQSAFLQDTETGEKLEILTGYPGKEDIEYNYINGQWRKRKKVQSRQDLGKDNWYIITNEGSINSLNKFFNKERSSTKEILKGYPGKEENEYRVDKLVNGQEVWSVRRKGQEEFTVISDEGSISALNRQFGKSVKPSEDAKKKREAQITRQKSYEEFNGITSDFVSDDSDDQIGDLRKKYGKLGFSFKEVGKGDQIEITASNDKKIIINFDNWTDETDRENARNLRKFLQENQQLGDYVDLENEEIKRSKEKYLDITKVDFDEQRARLMSAGSQKEFEKAKEENAKEIASKPIAALGAEAMELREKIVTGDYNRQQRIADLSRVANTEEERKDLAAIAVANRDSFVQKNKINDKYVNDLALSRKDVVNELSELNKEIERVNSSQSSMTEEEYNSEMSRLKTEYDDLIIKDNQINSDINKVYTIEEQNQKDAALYFAYNEQQGSVGGGLWNSFVKGVFGVTGLVDPDAPDFFAKMLGSEMTTEEFMQSEDRWDITKASFSVAESVGALAAAVLTGGTTKAAGAGKILTKSAETLPFFSMSYNEIKSEMDSEEFKGIPSWQKEGLAIIYGLGVGYLDKLSTTFGATGKIPQAISKGIIFRAISGLGKDATTDAIERAIASQFKKDIAAGLIKIAGGSVLEGATEGVQSLYGSALKAGFNWMQGKDENGKEIKPFDVSNWAKDAVYEAYMGALGGTIMSVPSGAVRGIKNGFNRLSPSYMEMTKKVIEDSNLRSMLITDIKTKLMSGKITKDEAQEQINAIKEASGLFAKMPDNLSPEGVAQSTDLLIERSKIEKEIAGKEDNLVVAQKARIAEINNELQTISQNAVKESTKPVEEGPAEGGGVQYQGTQEGQPEVREGERPVGETAQPEADLGDRAVEGRGEAEIEASREAELQPVLAAITAAETTGEVPTVNGQPVNQKTVDDINAKYDAEIAAAAAQPTTAEQIAPSLVTLENATEFERKAADIDAVRGIEGATRAARAAKSVLRALPGVKIHLHSNRDEFMAGVASTEGISVQELEAEFGADARGVFTKGEIHINLDNADASTVFHEAFHYAFAKSGKTGMREMVNGIKKAVGKKNFGLISWVDTFEERYIKENEILPEDQRLSDEAIAEEFMSELGAILSESAKTLDVSTLQKIANVINNIAKKIIGRPVLSKSASRQEIIDMMNDLSSKMRQGKEIDFNSLGLTGTISVNDSTNRKKSIVGDIIRFDVNKNTKVEENVPLSKFNGRTTNTIESDRMTGGYIKDDSGAILFKFLGGVQFPVITGKWWASQDASKAKKIATNANDNRDADGYIYGTPMVGSEKQHMSNNDMLLATTELMKLDATSRNTKVTKSDVINLIDKAFKKKGLEAKRPIIKSAIKKSNSIADVFNELEYVLFQENDSIVDRFGNNILDSNGSKISKLTFEERKSIIETLLGNATVRDVNFPSAGNAYEAAARFAEPITDKAQKIGDIVTVMRTKGTLKYKKTDRSDEFYHKSYPYEIYAENEDGTPAEIEVFILDAAYSMRDVLPVLTKKSGEKFTWDEYLAKHGPKSEKVAEAQYNRTAKLSVASGEIKSEKQRQKQIILEKLSDGSRKVLKDNYFFLDKKEDIIKAINHDIELLNERIIAKGALESFEELIIPSLGDEVLVPVLSEFQERILMDPNATPESIQRGFDEAKKIIDKEGSIDQSKITEGGILNGDKSINLPNFERFVEKNPEYEGVFKDWKKLLDKDLELILKDTKAFRYPNIKELEILLDELKDTGEIKSEKRKKQISNAAIDKAREKYNLSIERGNSIEQAQKSAMADLKKNEWYVQATDTEREDAVRTMRKFFGFKEKSAPSAGKISGKKKKKVTVDEYVALKDQIKLEAKAAKAGAKSVSDAVKAITSYFNKIKDRGNLTRSDITKILGIISNVKDQKSLDNAADRIFEIVNKAKTDIIEVSQKAALKDQLRLEALAARQSSQSLKQKQRQLVALINEMKRGGIVTAQQASALAKRVVMTNVDNPIMVERMLQYAERLFERADYQQKLQEANSLQKKIKSKLKSKGLQASVVSVAKDFSKIQPWMLSDIDAYIEQANNVLNAVRPSRLGVTTGVDIDNVMDQEQISVSAQMRTSMSFKDVSEYIENTNKEIEEYRKAEILAVNNDLVAAGVISKDMKLKEILEIIGELRDPETKLPAEEKRAAILSYIGSVMDVYRPIVESMLNGRDPFTGEAVELTDRQKEVASDMMKIDVTKMDIRDAVQVIEAMDNFITNGIIDGVEAITNTYNGQRNAEKVAAKGFKTKSVGAGKVGNLWAYNMMSLPVLSDWIFRGTKRAQYVLDNIGINKFIKGVAQATSRWRKYTDEYYEAFTDEKLFLKISPIKVRVWKKANGKDFMDPENIYERGMYAFLKRTVTGDQKAQEKELKRKIKLIKDSVDVLREEGDAKDAKVADMYDMLIEKLGLNDANLTISDIESRVDKLNIDAVNWWVNTWADNYSQLADVSQSVYNTILDKDMFYTPDKFSSLDPNNSENVDELMNKMGGGGFASVLNYEYDKKTGVLMPSSKPVSMEQKRYVNLNFDNNNQRALKAALIDINTAAATKQIKGFFKSKNWNKVITNKSDRDLFRKRVDEYILRSRNKQVGTDDQTIGEVERSLRIWASMGATRALGSIFQPFKQTIPIFVNTLMNAGKHTTFAFGRDQHRWIDAIEMPISNRGIESIAAFDDADAALDRSIAAGKIEKALDVVEKVNTKWLKLVLAKPDVFAARSAFIAYYKKALEAKGKSTDIDYNNPSDVDQEALNYAQHMVDRQQNASDAMLMGDLFTSGQSLKKIMKNTLFPFMSFVVNQKSRMTTDVSIMFSGDASRADRKAAARSLGGLILEMAAFHSLSFAIKYLIINSIASVIGGEDEPEEEDVQKSLERQLSYTIGTVAKDIFSPVPLFTDSPVIYGADFLMKKIAPSYMEDDAKEALKTENEARELSGKPALEGKKAQEFIDNYIEERRIKASQYDSQGPGGVYRITLDKGIEVYKSLNLAYNGEFESEGFGGKMETKYIDSEGQDKMKEIMPYYLAWSALGIPAEFGSVFRKIENNVKKENKLTEKQHEALNEVLEATGRKKEGEVEKYLVKKMRATQTESSSERVLNELDWIDSQGGLKNERQVKKYIEIFETEGSVGIRDMQEIQKLK